MAHTLKKRGHIVCESNDDVDRIRPKPDVLYTVVGSISSLCVARMVAKCMRVGAQTTVPLGMLDGSTTPPMMSENAKRLAWGLHVNNVDLHNSRLNVTPHSMWEEAVKKLENQYFYSPPLR